MPRDKNYYRNDRKFVELKDVCDYGHSNPVKFDVLPEKMLLIELENIPSGENALLKKIYVDPRKISLTSRTFFKKGMILYSKLRPYLDKVIIADDSGVCSSEIVPFNSYINPEFLILFLRTKEFINQVKTSSYGVRMPRVKKLSFQTAKMPLISEEAMNETVKKWKEITLLL